jgi:hypothetical protein
MNAVNQRLFKRFDSQQIKGEVEEELRFHLELLTEALLRQHMSPEEAKAVALERFGNLEQTKDQCVEISTRNSPLRRALRSFLILVFLVGVLIRVFSPEFHLTHIGAILIAVGILGRLLLYVRGLKPSSFLSSHEDLSLLILNEEPRASFAVYDQRKRTPVERVISDQ